MFPKILERPGLFSRSGARRLSKTLGELERATVLIFSYIKDKHPCLHIDWELHYKLKYVSKY